jgi:hypothetical protein
VTTILAIDPGPRLSAYVELAGAAIVAHGKISNLELLQMLRAREPSGPLVVEMVAPYGKPVGREVFETCVWIGRYLEAWRGVGRLLERREVKQALGLRAGGSKAATDADVRSALIVRWGGQGGKRARAPAALAGIVDDEWAALAVAVAWRDQHAEAFAAVEDAPLSDLEDLNRALGLVSDGVGHGAAAQSSASEPAAGVTPNPAPRARRSEKRAPVQAGELQRGAR